MINGDEQRFSLDTSPSTFNEITENGKPLLVRDTMLEILSIQNNSGWLEVREQMFVMLGKTYGLL
jgi:hypothetical protein